MNDELLVILEHIEREKGIDKEILFNAIESALQSAARKIVGKNSEEEIIVSVDRKTGAIKIFKGKTEIKSDEFGRIAAQTAKQVIIQKIREAERNVIFDDFQTRVNSLVTGTVHRFEKGNIIIDLGRTEAILSRRELSPKDNFKQGDRVKAFISEVKKTSRGPEVVLSRTSSGFVKKLFELEVPEIYEGIVEIRSIAREPGERTKISVYSKDERVDGVGACVGMRGDRVKNIVRELNGERIDIVRWSDDIKEYVKGALSPAELSEIKADKTHLRLDIVVNDDQLSLSIGKHGQNVRLASKLIGWEINIKSKGELKSKKEEEKKTSEVASGESKAAKIKDLLEIDGVGKKIKERLIESGLDSLEKIKNSKLEDLVKIEGIGKKLAERILKSAKTF